MHALTKKDEGKKQNTIIRKVEEELVESCEEDTKKEKEKIPVEDDESDDSIQDD